MTPAEFDTLMTELCRTTDPKVLHKLGLDLIDRALGGNAHSYLNAIDAFCCRVRFLSRRKSFNSPTTESIAAAKRERGAGL